MQVWFPIPSKGNVFLAGRFSPPAFDDAKSEISGGGGWIEEDTIRGAQKLSSENSGELQAV